MDETGNQTVVVTKQDGEGLSLKSASVIDFMERSNRVNRVHNIDGYYSTRESNQNGNR